MRARAIRLLRVLALGTLSLLFALFAFVQIQQAIFHHQVVRLLADAQAIELHRSTWADAQTLMHRWGRWGGYKGQCTEASCAYEVSIDDALSRLYVALPEPGDDRSTFRWFQSLRFLGARDGSLTVKWIVVNGLFVRKAVEAVLDVAPLREGEDGYALTVTSKSTEGLYSWLEYSSHTQRFASHPLCTAWRPTSCMDCMLTTVAYSSFAPPETVREVSTFNTNCFLPYSRCRVDHDLLPIAKQFAFYDNTESSAPRQPLPCSIPIWARARDADLIVLAQSLEHHVKPPTDVYQEATVLNTVKVLDVLKGGPTKFGIGSILEVGGDERSLTESERLQPTSRYLLFSYGDTEAAQPYPFDALELQHCGVAPATPANFQQVQDGLRLNDHLLSADMTHFP